MQSSTEFVAQATYARRLIKTAAYSAHTPFGDREFGKCQGLDWFLGERLAQVLEDTRNEAAVIRVLIGFARELEQGRWTEEILAEADRVLSFGWRESERHRIVGLFSDHGGCADDTAAGVLKAAYYSLMGAGLNLPRVIPPNEDRSCEHATIQDAAIDLVRSAYSGAWIELDISSRSLSTPDRERVWEHALAFVERMDAALQQVRPLPVAEDEAAHA